MERSSAAGLERGFPEQRQLVVGVIHALSLNLPWQRV